MQNAKHKKATFQDINSASACHNREREYAVSNMQYPYAATSQLTPVRLDRADSLAYNQRAVFGL
jgi:hypothetical protein